MVVQFRVPVPTSTALLNALGVAGLIAIIFSIGALTSWQWGVMAFGVIAVGIVVLAQTSAASTARPAARSVADLEAARGRKAA